MKEDSKPIRVLLARMPPILSDLLQQLLRAQSDMDVTEVEGQEHWELLAGTHRTEAQVVILPLSASGEVGGVCTHLLTVCPDLFILALPTAGRSGFVFRRTFTAEPVVVESVDKMLQLIRGLCDE